ncbi:MAG: class I SAM-dependent methyltransferase [Bacteroidia bacterium]|nr:class I SAM-dependent methyltransferase [Bacteroidia bacterium]
MTCIICQSKLVQVQESYNSEVIQNLWMQVGVELSSNVIKELPLSVEFFECSNCRFGTFQPLIEGTSEFYNDISNEKHYYLDEKWEYNMALEDLEKCQKILEIGCGEGYFVDKLLALGKEVKGIDKNNRAVMNAQIKSLPITDNTLDEVVHADRGSYDAVCAFQVLEHVEAPLDFIRSANSLLKTDGYFIVAVPNSSGILKYLRPSPTDCPPHHLTRWTARCFNELRRYGFEVVRLKREPLDSHRFHWLFSWWDSICNMKDVQCRSWIEEIELNLFWAVGRFTLSAMIQILRWIGIKELRFLAGHTLYVTLRKIAV